MKPITNKSGYMPPIKKINEQTYKQALQILSQHFTIPCAPNSQYSSQELIESLVYLTVEKAYAESGLQNLACTHKAPSADTLLRRVESIKQKDAYRMLTEANNCVVGKLKRKGIFKKAVLGAADLSDDPYYGEYNNKICGGEPDRGTTQFYRHASIHVVEAGKRATLYTAMVTPFDDHASVIEKLVLAVRSSRISIDLLLIDRGFNGVEVVNKSKQLRQDFLMPAKKTMGVKKAILDYDKGKTSAVINYTIKGAEKKQASCRLFMVMKKDALPTDAVVERYFAFFTNLSVERVILAYETLPEEYLRGGGLRLGLECRIVCRLRQLARTTRCELFTLCFQPYFITSGCWLMFCLPEKWG